MNSNNCGCNSGPVDSWYALQNSTPKNPLDLIEYASLNSAVGVFTYSDDYAPVSATWVASGNLLNDKPSCSAVRTDNIQRVQEALWWNFRHLTANTSANLAPPLQKMIYLRGGEDWKMTIPINLGASVYNNIQLSFRDNAGTRKDYADTIPVIQWSTGTFTGVVPLTIVLKNYGHVVMGLQLITTTGDRSMYESEWIIVP